ncbi:hypothetical protein [Streptomyces sp. NPDC056491]
MNEPLARMPWTPQEVATALCEVDNLTHAGRLARALDHNAVIVLR